MKRIKRLIWIAATLSLTGIVWPDASIAAGTSRPLGPEWVPVEAERLEAMRGGFIAPSGLVLSFGFERVAFVNGELVASTRIDIPDVGRMTGEQAQALGAFNETTLVQIGDGNVFQPAGAGGLVIQNTLDGQMIQALTTVNVSVNTLDLFKQLNLSSSLQDALNSVSTNP